MPILIPQQRIIRSGGGRSGAFLNTGGFRNNAPDPGDPPLPGNPQSFDFTAANGTALATYAPEFSSVAGVFEIQSNYLVATAGGTSEGDAIALADPPSSTYKMTARVYLGNFVGENHSRLGVAFLGETPENTYFYRIQVKDDKRGVLRRGVPGNATGLQYWTDAQWLVDSYNDLIIYQLDLGNDVYRIELWVNKELVMTQDFRSPPGLKYGLVIEGSSIAGGVDARFDDVAIAPYAEEHTLIDLQNATLTNFSPIQSNSPQIVSTAETNYFYTGGTAVQLDQGETSGTIAFTYDGPSGNYDLIVRYISEARGVPEARIQGAAFDQTWYFTPSNDFFVKEFALRNVALTSGETITITGTQDGDYSPKFDSVRIHAPTTGGTAGPTTRVQNGVFSGDSASFNDDSEPAASDGSVRRINTGGFQTADLTYSFAGTNGVYDLTIGYLREEEGAVTYTIQANGRTESFNSTPTSVGQGRIASSATFINWSLNNNDTITVTMDAGVVVGSGTPKGRFDYLDYTGPNTPGTTTYEGTSGSAIASGSVSDQVGSGQGSGGNGVPNPPTPGVTYLYDIDTTQQPDADILAGQFPNVDYDPFSVVPDPAGGGFNCWRYELRNDAQTEEVFSGMRAEHRFRSNHLLQFDREYWHGFGILLSPETHSQPFDEGRGLYGQWHGSDNDNVGGPPLALNFKEGRIIAIIRSDPDPVSDPSSNNYIRVERRFDQYGNYKVGQWMNFVVRTVFNFNDSGIVQIWIDGQELMFETVRNAHNDSAGPYFKLGIYAVAWNNGKTSDKNRQVVYWSTLRIYEGSNGYNFVFPGL